MRALKFLYVIAFFLIISCKESSVIKIEQELSCDDWKEIARLDISQKKMYIINYGLRDEFSDYFDRIKNKYHIEIKEDYGCLVSDGIFCYNDAMINYIESRLGNVFGTE